MEEVLSDGRPWIMGDQFTLVETTSAPLIKVMEMLRLLHLWLEGRPNVQRWWETLTKRQSFTELEEYPGQSEDDDAPHAKAGIAAESEFKALLKKYRETIPQL